VTIPGLGNPIDGGLDEKRKTYTSKGTTFLTDMVFSNPNGQEGALVVMREGTELIKIRLENIRDYDLHWVTPIVIGNGQSLQLSLTCTDKSRACDPSVLYSGYLRP
jgi:hypothetical protein